MIDFRLFLGVVLGGCLCTGAVATSDLPTLNALASLVADDLDAHQPRVELNLDFAASDAETGDLERLGLIESVGERRDDCGAQGHRLLVTEKGQRIASSFGWAIWNGKLDIALGRLVLAGPVKMLPVVSPGRITAVMRFRLMWNKNATYLSKTGPPGDWIVLTYPGTRLRLLENDATFESIVTFFRNKTGSWAVEPAIETTRNC